MCRRGGVSIGPPRHLDVVQLQHMQEEGGGRERQSGGRRQGSRQGWAMVVAGRRPAPPALPMK